MNRVARWKTWGIFIAILLGFVYVENHARNLLSSMERRTADLAVRQESPLLVTFGFDHLLADITLLQAQLFYSDHKPKPRYESMRTLYNIARTVLRLDPRRVEAPLFANFALADMGLYGVTLANDLLEQAWRRNPDVYRLASYIGFNHYEHDGNPLEIVRWMRLALLAPDADKSLIWVADNALKAQNTGYEMHQNIMCTQCKEAEDERQKLFLCKKCRQYAILHQLELARKAFEKRAGRPLRLMGELISEKFLREIPEDPFGGQWEITENGRIDSSKNRKTSILAEEK